MGTRLHKIASNTIPMDNYIFNGKGPYNKGPACKSIEQSEIYDCLDRFCFGFLFEPFATEREEN